MRLINIEAAKLAKRCTAAYMAKNPGTKKFVAGAVGPTSKTLSVSPSVENPAFRCGLWCAHLQSHSQAKGGVQDEPCYVLSAL